MGTQRWQPSPYQANIQRISRRIIQRLHPFVADTPRLLVEEVLIKQRFRRAYGETPAKVGS